MHFTRCGEKGENLDYINKIVDDYNLRDLINSSNSSEEQASQFENYEEKECSCDYENPLSIYSLINKSKEININISFSLYLSTNLF